MKVTLNTEIKEIEINPIELIAALSGSSGDAQSTFINLFAEHLQKVRGESDFSGMPL